MASEASDGGSCAKRDLFDLIPYCTETYVSPRGVIAGAYFWKRSEEFELTLERVHEDGTKTLVEGGRWPSIEAARRAARALTDAMTKTNRALELRERLVRVCLDWESHFGVAPSATSAISELDAALLVGMDEEAYCRDGATRTAVSKDVDFICEGLRYQVTANRPSGKKGSTVTLVSKKTEKKRPFGWNRLIWILYDRLYQMQEAWEFTTDEYRRAFDQIERLSPSHMRQGRRLFRA